MNLNEKILKDLAKGKKLLLIEDDLSVQEVLKSFLKNFFSLIKIASNGDEAWTMYRKENFDLVISDIEMPGTNGVMLSKGIKARNPEQAVVITSAYTDEKYLVELINIGVDGFLKKPLNIDNLYTVVIKALRQVQVRTETYRVKFKAVTEEITKKEILVSKSPIQKKIEEQTSLSAKICANEFLEKIKTDDPESYKFFVTQKENIMEVLHELIDDFEMFSYKNYEDFELFNKIPESLSKLYDIFSIFDKIKYSNVEIFRLVEILQSIHEDQFYTINDEAFDMLEFLLNDIKQFIFDMFIEMNVNDVTYFKDSFKENITAFEQVLHATQDDEIDDDIEFL